MFILYLPESHDITLSKVIHLNTISFKIFFPTPLPFTAFTEYKGILLKSIFLKSGKIFHTLLTHPLSRLKLKTPSKKNPSSWSLLFYCKHGVPSHAACQDSQTRHFLFPGGCGGVFTAPLSISLSLILMAASFRGSW